MSVERTILERRAGSALRIAAALALPFVALAVHGLARPFLDESSLLLFYPAAFFSAWIAGPLAGVVATVLSAILAGGPLFGQAGATGPSVDEPWVSLVIFVATGIAFALAQARMSLSASRKSFTNALRHSEARWRFALEGGGQGLWDWDIERGKVDVSPSYKRLLGYRADEDLGDSVDAAFARVHPDDRGLLDAAIDSYLRGDTETFFVEFRIQCKDGGYIWVESRGMAMRSRAGRPQRMIGTHVDISRRKTAEAAVHDLTANLEAKVAERTQQLSEVTERLRSVLNAMAEGVVLVGPDGKVIDANPAAEAILGLRRDELLGWLPTDSAWRAMREDGSPLEPADYPVEQTRRTGRAVRSVVMAISAPGQGQRWLNVSSEPIGSGAEGMPRLVVSTFTDITDLKSAEASLRTSEMRWRYAIEGSGDGLWDWSVPDSRVFYSDQWKRMLGFGPGEVGDGLDEWSKRVHPDDLAATLASVQAHLDGKTPCYVNEHRVQCKDGSYKWVLDRGMVMVRDEHGAAVRVVGTHTDITERKQAERELSVAQERLQLALQIGKLGVWDWDRDSGQLHWDDRSHEMFGVADTVRRQGIDREFWRERVHPLDLEDAEERFRIAERTGRPVESVYRIVLPDGSVRHIQAVLQVENDSDGRPVRMVCVNRDVTGTVELEHDLRAANDVATEANAVLTRGKEELECLVRERTQALTTALDRVEAADRAKDAFLAATSHELRTPLNAIIGFSSLILDGAMGELDERQRRPLGMIRQSGTQLLQIVRNILDITSIEADRFGYRASVVDLCAVLGRQLAAARERAESNDVELRSAGCGQPLYVIADPERVGQVVHNLLDNAMRFTDVGHIQISVSLAGSHAEVLVEDTGVGIPPDQMEKLFQAFKPILNQAGPRRAGTGLGLAVSRRIVEAMGGSMSAESSPQQGSRFKFTLPLADMRAGEGAAQ